MFATPEKNAIPLTTSIHFTTPKLMSFQQHLAAFKDKAIGTTILPLAASNVTLEIPKHRIEAAQGTSVGTSVGTLQSTNVQMASRCIECMRTEQEHATCQPCMERDAGGATFDNWSCSSLIASHHSTLPCINLHHLASHCIAVHHALRWVALRCIIHI